MYQIRLLILYEMLPDTYVEELSESWHGGRFFYLLFLLFLAEMLRTIISSSSLPAIMQ